MRTPSSQKCRLDLAPPLADRFILGVTPSLTARYFSSCLSDSPHGGHPALRSTASGGFRSVLAVSSFRLHARLDVSIPSSFLRPARLRTPLLDIAPLIERHRDLNPPEQRAAQRALPDCRRSTRNRDDSALSGLFYSTLLLIFRERALLPDTG